MGSKKRKSAKVAVALAVSSALILPGYAVAIEKAAQPGTVRPSERAQAQPGTSKKEARAKSNEVVAAEPVSQQAPAPATSPAPKPAPAPAPAPKPASAPKPAPKAQAQPVVVSNQADTAAVKSQSQPPRPAVEQANYTPTPTQRDVAKDSVSTVKPSMAERATEKPAEAPVREGSTETDSAKQETKPVRTEQADEVAVYELAAVIAEDGDVRNDALREDQAVIREGDDEELTPVDAPADGQDDDGDEFPTTAVVADAPGGVGVDSADGPQAPPNPAEGTTDMAPQDAPVPGVVADPAPVSKPVVEVAAGVTVDFSTGAASGEVELSPAETSVSASVQQSGAHETEVGASFDPIGQSVSVDAAGAQVEVEIPQVPTTVVAAVEQSVPAEVSQAVDQSVAQVQEALTAQVGSLPTGEQVTQTAVGEVSTWLQIN